MGKCIYCGQKAGMFKSKHEECERRYNDGIARIEEIVNDCFRNKKEFKDFKPEIDTICAEGHISEDTRDEAYCHAFDESMARWMDEDTIDAAKALRIGQFIIFTELPEHVLDCNGSLNKMLKSKMIHAMLHGRTPDSPIKAPKNLPFTLDEDEHIVWIFPGVTFKKEKGVRDYEEMPEEMKVKSGKGIYYRTSAFEGYPMETNYMETIDKGPVCLTDKYFYFTSPEANLKIPFGDIEAIDPYPNGMGMRLKDPGERPYFFVGMDIWLVYNTIMAMK